MYSVKILQNSTKDLFNSIALNFANKTYLFNCSDGSQRNFGEQGLKFHKVNEVFFSSSEISAYPGIFGFIMSRSEQVADNNIHGASNKNLKEANFEKKRVMLYGPDGLKNRFVNCRGFFNERILNDIYEFKENKSMFVRENKESLEYLNAFEDTNLKVYSIATSANGLSVLNYFCIPHQNNRPFLPERAKALGLKPGPKFNLLVNNFSVENDKGEIITPDQVLGEAAPSSAVAYLYSPTVEHGISLAKKLADQTYFFTANADSKENQYSFAVVIHIIGDLRLLESPAYQELINSFDSKTIHIFDSPDTNFKFMINESKLKIKYVLNKINPKLFSLGNIEFINTLPNINLSKLIEDNKINVEYIDARAGMEYILHPISKQEFSAKQIYDPFYYSSSRFLKFKDESDKYFKEANHLPVEIISDSKRFFNEPELIFLGTASMKPGFYRNVSAILLKLGETNSSILLDCGEGTFQQIYSHYGQQETDDILESLRVVFVTHKHGDHMLGLPKIIEMKDNLISARSLNYENSKTYLIVPKNVLVWITSIVNSVKNKNSFIVIDCQDLNPNQDVYYHKYVKQENHYKNFVDVELAEAKQTLSKIKGFRQNIANNKELQIIDFYETLENKLGIELYAIEVFHCDDSFGALVKACSNMNLDPSKLWSITYSGDTRPCNNFINYSKQCTAIIHEATLEDELFEFAKDRLHTCFSEAINVGLSSNTWRVILTHFSARYIKESPWSSQFDYNSILAANDYLRVNLSELETAFKYGKDSNKALTDLSNSKLL